MGGGHEEHPPVQRPEGRGRPRRPGLRVDADPALRHRQRHPGEDPRLQGRRHGQTTRYASGRHTAEARQSAERLRHLPAGGDAGPGRAQGVPGLRGLVRRHHRGHLHAGNGPLAQGQAVPLREGGYLLPDREGDPGSAARGHGHHPREGPACHPGPRRGEGRRGGCRAGRTLVGQSGREVPVQLEPRRAGPGRKRGLPAVPPLPRGEQHAARRGLEMGRQQVGPGGRGQPRDLRAGGGARAGLHRRA